MNQEVGRVCGVDDLDTAAVLLGGKLSVISCGYFEKCDGTATLVDASVEPVLTATVATCNPRVERIAGWTVVGVLLLALLLWRLKRRF